MRVMRVPTAPCRIAVPFTSETRMGPETCMP